MAATGIRVSVLESLGGEFFDELDASLQMAYAPRDPVTEFVRGDITARALRVLGESLPLTSSFARANQGHTWTDETWLMHDVSTHMRFLFGTVANFLGATPKVRPKPLPTPLDNASVADAAEQERLAQQKAEMDVTMTRIFANPN